MPESFAEYFMNKSTAISKLITRDDIKKILVTAGPYRPYALSVAWVNKDKGIINIDWYSALRVGFGTDVPSDVVGKGIDAGDIDEIHLHTIDAVRPYADFDIQRPHIEWFRKYCRVQLEGKFNMLMQPEMAAEEAGLSMYEYAVAQILYRDINEQYPEIRKQIETEIINNLKEQ
jgi:hypothetical protein